MFIKSLVLGDFKRLQFAKIKELHIDTSKSHSHLILGTNGSGKSSVLRELFPTAPTKSGFVGDGFKELTLNHDNSEYKLTYSPTEGHQFFRDHAQLNTGMTNDIQKELINKYFNVSGDIQAILTCSLNICDMVPSQRKKILMNLNPIDVSLFLEKHQKVRKHTQALGSNLDRLYQRQKELMEQRLPEQQYKLMLERQQVLNDQEKILLIWGSKVTDESLKYAKRAPASSLAELKQYLVSVIRKSGDFSGVSRKDYYENGVEYATQIKMHEQLIGELEKAISNTTEMLNEYDRKKKQLGESGVELITELNECRLKLAQCKEVDPMFNPISESELLTINGLLDSISKMLVDLSYIDREDILDKSQLQVLDRDAHTIQFKLQTAGNELKDVARQIETLKATVKTYKLGTPCDANGCELLASYTNHFSSKKAELEKLQAREVELKGHVEEWSEDYRVAKEIYTTQQLLWVTIDRLFKLIREHRSLASQYSESYILQRVREAPFQLINDINQYITDSEHFHACAKLRKRILELEQHNNSIKSKQQLSSEVLDIEIQKYTTQLTELRAKRQTKLDEIDELTIKHSTIIQFISITDQLKQLDTKVTEILILAENQASYDYLVKLNTIINNLLTSTRTELFELSRLIRDQETLLVRLDKEVDSIIGDLKPKYDNSKLVEKSLYELPVKYTKTFVNSVIETTNYFISEVMTYSLRLEQYSESDSCDFSFAMNIENDVRAKDISSCSDGQKAVINLAFNLALIIELKYNDYPIYVDEIDRPLDPTHSYRLTQLLISLIAKGVVSQMFVVNHHATMVDNIIADIVVLNGDNIKLPAVYNEYVSIVTE